MRARDRRPQAEPADRVGEPGAQLAQLRTPPSPTVAVRVGRQLEREPVRLAARVLDERVGQLAQHVLGAPRRRAVGLEQHDLFLDADRPRLEPGLTHHVAHSGSTASILMHASVHRAKGAVTPPRGPQFKADDRPGVECRTGGRSGLYSRYRFTALIGRTFGPMGRGRPPQIVAYGGGGFCMEPGNPLLDEYVLSLCRRKKPRVCFFPSASGDADHYVVRFYRHFSSDICDPSHISLFRRDCGPGAVREHLLKQDLIYVGGGSILSLLGVWRAHGIDEDLRAAWQAGVILCGVSAGSLCWFASGLTAYHHDAKPYEGLGFLPHSNAVHYEEESNRRPAYHAALLDGELPGGYAASDGAALHFVGEDLHRVVLSRPEARAYRVEAVGDEVVELPLEATYLGDRPKIALAAA